MKESWDVKEFWLNILASCTALVSCSCPYLNFSLLKILNGFTYFILVITQRWHHIDDNITHRVIICTPVKPVLKDDFSCEKKDCFPS